MLVGCEEEKQNLSPKSKGIHSRATKNSNKWLVLIA